MSLWTSKEIAEATGGKAVSEFAVESLSIDTRSLEKGALFIPLKDARDGHDFIPQAIQAGAAGTLSDRPLSDTPHVQVKDTLEALNAMATAARVRSNALRIGVTGSVGKTSVKDALAVMFAGFGAVHWSKKSFNNHWGVPLTLASMPKATDFGVFEMGMNHAGEISVLTEKVRSEIALITTIAPAHLAQFPNVEAIADAKAEIIEGLPSDGTLILNADNAYTPQIRAKADGRKVLTFGHSAEADIRILSSDVSEKGVQGQLQVGADKIDFDIPIPGEHWAMNAAACIAVALASGVDLQKAANALGNIKASEGRGDETLLNIEGKSVTLIDESYNANPASMRAALSALSNRPGRRLAVLGDMYELGANEIKLHAELADPIEAAGVSRVIVTGECMRALRGALPQPLRGAWVHNADEAYEALMSETEDGDVVMIKGSNATGLGALSKRLKGEFG
jgi:UDP-N-acetylmuramoyl-tripeptide--D-alanyl-D-alanine ligase